MKVERRFASRRVQVDKRADGKSVLTGYGAVFYRADDPGTQCELYTDVYERIMPTAFDSAMREKDDARGLFNHDINLLLGRVSSGTMRLSVDTVGLRYEIDPPENATGSNVVESVKRGDVTGSSFSFFPYTAKRGKVVWLEEKLPDGRMITIREIHDLELVDVGPVTFPAYDSSTASMRAAGGDVQDVLAELRNWQANRQAPSDIDFDLLIGAARALGAG